MVFISWEPPHPTFLKVNFDDSVTDRTGEAGFIIQDPKSRLIVARDMWLVDTSISSIELRAI